MRLFFFTQDEFACPELTRKYADKLWHGLGSALLVTALYIWFGWSPLVCGAVVLGLGILWEIVIDVWILNNGVSKYDLLADLLGVVLGMVISFIGG